MSIVVFIKENSIGFRSEKDKEKWNKVARKYAEPRAEVIPLVSESRKARGYFHGGVLALWAYLNDQDWLDDTVLDNLFYHAKTEYLGSMTVIDGKTVKTFQSSKGQLEFLKEKVVEHLEVEYGIDRTKHLNNEEYKDWRDRIYPNGGPDNYIDYMVEIKRLPITK
jgi:hypothetical protein